MTFRTLLLGHHDDHTKDRISDAMDRMSPEARLATVRAATPKDQAKLWELYEGSLVEPTDLVPAGTDPLTEVIHEGKNTLPAHTQFQKRFCRPEGEDEPVFGYNHQTFSWATGPGYFVARTVDGEGAGEPTQYGIDYRELPSAKPDDWPKIQANEKGLSRLVYAGMTDYLRKVSEHIFIGRAYKKGKPVGAYFLLCRQDAAEE